ALSRLLVTVERYPDLKSNQNFLALQSQLEGTENRIAVERRRFNEAVRDYNQRLNLFPGSLVASFRGFKPKAYFEAAPGSEQAPKGKFYRDRRSGPTVVAGGERPASPPSCSCSSSAPRSARSASRRRRTAASTTTRASSPPPSATRSSAS